MATAKKVSAKKVSAKQTATPKAALKTVATKKIATTAKAAPKVDIPAWNAVHVFGYGETQIVGRDINGKIANAKLKALEPLFVHLAEKQQKGTKITLADTRVLTFFNGTSISFHPKPNSKNKTQSLAWTDIDQKYIDKLVKELNAFFPLSQRSDRKLFTGFKGLERKKATSVKK